MRLDAQRRPARLLRAPALNGRPRTGAGAPRALIVGVAGTELGRDEAAFLAEAGPWGAILFARNIDNPDQVHRLTGAITRALGRPDAPILVDQEGGRIQRLGPPHWREYPAARRIGELYGADRDAGLEAARLATRLIAHDLASIGITVSCLPVLDLGLPQTHGVIGDRAYSADPGDVAALGRAAARGLIDGGCLPVMKHVPGHGRATCDSHLELPVVAAGGDELQATDFAPFRELRDLPMAMTAHILYEAFDRVRPATLSAPIIEQVIRDEIGFDGLLMSDDLSMQALTGSIGERAAASIAAGCDVVLHCNGDLREMVDAASAVPRLAGKALERAEAALACRRPPAPLDVAAARDRLDHLLGAIV